MRRILTLVVGLLLAASPAYAQQPSVTEVTTVSSTAVGLGTTTLTNQAGRQATACVFTVETDEIRLRYDGTDPTDAVGHKYSASAAFQISGAAELRALRMIRVTNDATVTVTCSFTGSEPALAAAGGGGGGGAAGTVAISQTGNENAVDVLTIAAGNNNIGDVDVASIAAGNNNIGDVDVASIAAEATDAAAVFAGACTPGSIIGGASVNETEIKDTGGYLDWIYVSSLDATPVYLKLYDIDNDDLDENDTPIARIMIPANATAANGAGATTFIPAGMTFSTAISFRVTTGLADNSTGALTANEVLINWCYR